MESNRRNINRRIQREEEERLARQNEERLTRQNEERLAREEEERTIRDDAFRTDNRNFGFQRDERPITQPPNISFTHRESNNIMSTDQYVAQNIGFTGGWNNFMNEARDSIVNELESKRGSKILFSATVKMRRVDGEHTKYENKNIRVKEPIIIYEGTNINNLYDEIMGELDRQMDQLQDTEGSGWEFLELDKINIQVVPYDPLNASKWIPLPKHIADKKAVINIQNKDENCFVYCIARAISPTDKNPQRVHKKLKETVKTLNMDGIRVPTPLDDIEKFEAQNPDIAVVVLGLNEFNNVIPLITSDFCYEREHLVILLMVKDEEENYHYTLVKDGSKLLSKQHSKYEGQVFICWKCFNVFTNKDKYLYHKDLCKDHKTQRIIMPKPGSFLKFEKHQHTIKYPFAVYADIESLTKKIEYSDVNPEISYTTKIQKHEPISYVFRFVSFDQSVLENKTIIHTGEDAMEDLVVELEYLASIIYNKPQAKIIYNREDKIKHVNTECCHVCGGGFGILIIILVNILDLVIMIVKAKEQNLFLYFFII